MNFRLEELELKVWYTINVDVINNASIEDELDVEFIECENV